MSQPGRWYRSRRRAAGAIALALAGTMALGSSALAANITVDAVGSLDEELPGTITFDGELDVAGTGFVFVLAGTRNCPSTAASVTNSVAELTPADGEPLDAGEFERLYSFTPPESGSLTACAYVAPSRTSAPDAAAKRSLNARVPETELTVTFDASGYFEGDGVVATLRARSAAAGRTLAYQVITSGDCPAGADGATWAATLSANLWTEEAFSFTGVSDARFTICAYVLEGAQVEAAAAKTIDRYAEATPKPTSAPTPTAAPPPTAAPAPVATASPVPTWATTPIASNSPVATATPRAAPVPFVAPQPALLTPRLVAPAADAEQYDRLHLRWSSDDDVVDEIRIWDEDPTTSDAAPVFVETTESDDVVNERLSNGDTVADIAPFLGFRTFWWRIKSTDEAGASAASEIRTVRIVPSPLDRSKAKASVKYTLRKSSRHPGTVRLRITASPRARVRVTVRHNGRVFATRKYTASVGTQRGFDFTLSCSQTGAFPYAVEIRDPYGAKVTRRGQWSVSPSRCASLRAAEQRKAAARRPKPSTGGGSAPSGGSAPPSGGSNCDPNYQGACLDPNASDYDCEGGSGDGPLYVRGPITVVGDDHFGLDGYPQNGIGCES